MELSFLGTRLFPVSCGGTLRALVPRFGRLEDCGMWLWEKVSRWMVFLRTGMRGDTPPGSFEGWVGHPSRWLWEKEFPGLGAPCGCISKSWSIHVFHLPLRQSTERKGQVGVRCSSLGALLLLTRVSPAVSEGALFVGLSNPQKSTYVSYCSPPTAPPVTFLYTPYMHRRSHTHTYPGTSQVVQKNVSGMVAFGEQAAPGTRELSGGGGSTSPFAWV